LNRLFDFEIELRANDSLGSCITRRLQEEAAKEVYHRSLARGAAKQIQDILASEYSCDEDGGMWASWDFS